jgi:hypothetical protein
MDIRLLAIEALKKSMEKEVDYIEITISNTDSGKAYGATIHKTNFYGRDYLSMFVMESDKSGKMIQA